MKNVFVAAVLAACSVIAQPLAAAGIAYECKVSNVRGQGYWLPEILFIGYDKAADKVIVSDPIILYYNDRQPVAGKLSRETGKLVSFSWQVKTKSRSGQFARMSYRATIQKPSGQMTITARPLGYENIFSSGGTCQTRDLK